LHACNPNTWQAKVVGSQVQGKPKIHSETLTGRKEGRKDGWKEEGKEGRQDREIIFNKNKIKNTLQGIEPWASHMLAKLSTTD
jgi:hypothetical protein